MADSAVVVDENMLELLFAIVVKVAATLLLAWSGEGQ